MKKLKKPTKEICAKVGYFIFWIIQTALGGKFIYDLVNAGYVPVTTVVEISIVVLIGIVLPGLLLLLERKGDSEATAFKRWLGLVISVAMIFVNVYGINTVGGFSDSLDQAVKTEALKPEKSEEMDKIVTKPFAVYLSGSDTRENTMSDEDKDRSDVNIIAVVNPDKKQVLLVNTPRDYYIPNPEGNGALDKLTHCGMYGVNTSMDALSDLYDIDLDYYVKINFEGFEKVIDAMDGIDVTIPEGQAVDGFYTDRSLSVKEGENHLDGKTALAFARERKAYTEGDIQRGRNQMMVINAILNKLKTEDIDYSELIKSMKGMFKTNLSSSQIRSLLRTYLDGGDWTVLTYTSTGTTARKVTYSGGKNLLSVVIPNEESVDHASELIKKELKGKRLKKSELEGSADSESEINSNDSATEK